MNSNGKKRAGFLLSEALLALFVTSLTVGVINGCLTLSHKAMELNASENIRMHVVQEKLEDYFRGQNFESKNIHPDSLDFDRIVKSKNMIKHKTLQLDSKRIYLLRLFDTDGGFEPILDHVQKIRFNKLSSSIRILIKLTNGKETEIYLHEITFDKKVSNNTT
ncbi:hypothetical protein ABM34_12485 [Companilactobacillus ginsenosidimutans]|uniref:Competence protein ComGF n=1 Tax=Companilactobacillus ginsenosidimutans TaxID=1007676 RepID=A0A0H4QK18_9LACO|nr:hypothetical protein ABM34_12485 [Companilactobacillus ginsenosidimutans]